VEKEERKRKRGDGCIKNENGRGRRREKFIQAKEGKEGRKGRWLYKNEKGGVVIVGKSVTKSKKSLEKCIK